MTSIPPDFKPNRNSNLRTREFLSAANDYSQQGMDCFNTCVTKFEKDSVLGFEKRCMQGCLQVSFQIYTTYATRE